MAKSKVAVLKVEPSTILESIARLCDLAGMKQAMDPRATTILKDNISWHFPFPAANTTPWQLEGTILALRASGFDSLSCVQNKTVVTDAFKGEDLNRYLPILSRYDVPVLYNFKPQDMTWVDYRPKAKMHVLDQVYPEGIKIPDYFFGKNIVHLPTVKCVGGDTRIMLGDGRVLSLKELVEVSERRAPFAILDGEGDRRIPIRVAVMAMLPSGEIKPCAATAVWRTHAHGRRVVRLRTRTGRTLTATADHRIHTPGGWRPIGELAVGERIATARRVRVVAASQELPQTHTAATPVDVVARSGRRYEATFNQSVIDAYQGGETATAVAASAGVRWQLVQSILKRHGVPIRRNIAQLRIPLKTSVEFWRWMGYVFAEGCIERGSTSDKLWWINSEPAIRDEFILLTRSLFDLRAVPHKSNAGVHIYSRRLGRFFEELGLPVPLHAGNKHVPACLFRCPDEEIAAFVSGYLDGDGHVSGRQSEVNATTKSQRLALDLQILLSRLGVAAVVRPTQSTIRGKWTESRLCHLISVCGDGLLRLSRLLTLRHPRKRARLAAQAARFAASKQTSNWDVVPLSPDLFRSVRTGLGVTQAGSTRPSSVNSLEHGHHKPTPRIARILLDRMRQADHGRRFSKEIATLDALAHEDLVWDQVSKVEDLPNEDIDLYDLTIPEAGSFVANGLVVHNCHIYTTTTGAMKNAFGGLLHTHRHYTHSWIHQTLVDLLAIQKEIHTGIFAVMDGTTAGNGPGPRTMFPVVKNFMLASADQVAIDAVAAKMMGFDPLSLEYIRVAHDDRLGIGDTRDIEVVGDDVSNESWGFRVGDNGASVVGDLLWFSPLKRFQKLFFRTPLVNLFIFGSETYHDYYRWPLKDRRVFEKWKRETAWGQLFERYATGPIGPASAARGSGAPAPRALRSQEP